MKSKIFIACICFNLFCLQIVKSQNSSSNPYFSIMFYNVENLYDTIDDIHTNDNEFLPSATKKWNSYKYYEKLKHITKVIMAAGKWHTPDIIGVSEVENSSCLWALTHHTNFSRLQYDFIHYDSPDKRGVDVALIYNPKTFIPLHKQAIPIHFENAPTVKTRDILYVKGLIAQNNDTLHVFVCHFPSRLGGQAKSESKRLFVAQVLRSKIDSIQSRNIQAHIAVIGDFNDSPYNKSIQNILQATVQPQDCIQCLTNSIDTSSQGTHAYKGNWEYLDQSIVSNSLLQDYEITNTVVKPDFILKTESKSGEQIPYRTYIGYHYQGGYSDHLPIIVNFFIQ